MDRSVLGKLAPDTLGLDMESGLVLASDAELGEVLDAASVLEQQLVPGVELDEVSEWA